VDVAAAVAVVVVVDEADSAATEVGFATTLRTAEVQAAVVGVVLPDLAKT